MHFPHRPWWRVSVNSSRFGSSTRWPGSARRSKVPTHLAPGYMPGKTTAAQSMHARHYVISVQVTCASCTGSSGNKRGGRAAARIYGGARSRPIHFLYRSWRRVSVNSLRFGSSTRCPGSARRSKVPAHLALLRLHRLLSADAVDASAEPGPPPRRRARRRWAAEMRGRLVVLEKDLAEVALVIYRWWVIVKPAGSAQRAHCCVSLEFSRGRAGSGSRPPLAPPGRSPGVAGPSLGSVSR